MDQVIVILGEPSIKNVFGTRQMVKPFVGAEQAGNYTQLGVGLILQNNDVLFEGLLEINDVIQPWRAMQIVSNIDSIAIGTLRGCLTVASPKVEGVDKHHLYNFIQLFEDERKFKEFYEEVLSSTPSDYELESMNLILLENDLNFEPHEVKEEESLLSLIINDIRKIFPYKLPTFW